ncbi:MAG TPA: cbb3-type cytochrome c oxidase subunit I [Chthoniobacterales bacterium]|jgi:cytochrome c oxidase cbb3-type subunit 1
MNPTGQITEEPLGDIEVTTSDVERVERALIDASTRLPVMIFYGSAIAWLLVSTFFGILTTIKLFWPDLFSNVAFLTWGRIQPVHWDSLIYGWGCMAGMGTAIWLMARLCRTTLRHPLVLIAGAAFWNVGVLMGLLGVLGGANTGYEWLEFPGFSALTLFFSYLLVLTWGLVMFRYRRRGHIYITQWYLLGAFLWFPWLYASAQVMLFILPVEGVMKAAVNWWFANNLLFLWFGSIGLGTAYYMIPKVIGRPVHSYYLAAIGFWSFALFSSWTGMMRLIDGPFPAWMITASIAAMILTIIPVATVGLNHHMTMRDHFPLMRYSPTLRFTVFGAIAYTAFSIVGVIISLRSMARIVSFSEATVGWTYMGLYAFFTMVIFGSMYYIVPRLVGREWRYASLIKLHFWASAYGIGLTVLLLLVGGFVQGLSLNDATLPFAESTQSILPYLRGRTLAWILLTVSHLVFAFHFGLMLLGFGRTASVPTFLNPLESKSGGAH